MIHLYSVCCDTDKNYMKTAGTGIYLSQLCKSNHPHSELWLGVNNDVYSVSQGSGSLLVLFTGGLSLFEQQLSWYYFLNQTSSIKAAELNQSSLQFMFLQPLTVHVSYWNFYKTCHIMFTLQSGFLIKPPYISGRHHVITWQQKVDLPEESPDTSSLVCGDKTGVSSQNLIISEHKPCGFCAWTQHRGVTREYHSGNMSVVCWHLIIQL